MGIRIVTDSTSDFGPWEAVGLGLGIVPLKTRFGDEEYIDGVTITPKEFYEKLVEGDVLPTTSQPSPAEFEVKFAEAVDAGDEVVAITISSELSGTYQSAVIAAERFEGRVQVVDSRSASIGAQILVRLAMRLLAGGISAAELAERLRCERERICVIALLDTLEYLKRGGRIISRGLHKERFREGDTLVVMADDSFMRTWGESSVFVMLANGKESEPKLSPRKRWLAIVLLLLMIVGATVGELPAVKEALPGLQLDMFFFVCITTVVMALTNIFPARKYTKFISWDILITIASAFAISRAMQNSGMADSIAALVTGMSHEHGPIVMLAVIFLITNIFTEIMTNNAAAALAFPIALSIAQHMGVDPTPFFVTICVAASASFSTPIGYQTNLIVQGLGNYKFQDFTRVGLPLNLITFALTVALVPLFWPF